MKNKKSFTVIELLVVIVIIGLISSVVLVSIKDVRGKARIAKVLEFSQSLHHLFGAYAVGIWNFDEGNETTALDSSGYGNNGTIYGASPTTDTPQARVGAGKGKYALSFDGVNDYVEILHAPSLSNFNSITVSAWLYMRSLGSWSRWLAKGEYGVAREWLFVSDVSYNILKFEIFSGGVVKGSGEWKNPSLNTWIHVVGMYDGAEVSLWVNGEKKTSLPFSGTRDYTEKPIRIAVEKGTTNFANGIIDEVRIYNSALTEAEIQKLYAEGAPQHGLALK